jgi:hypothetical protein
MKQVTLESVNENVESLKKMVLFMQEYLEDSFLNAEEEILVEKAIENYKAGKTKNFKDIKQN